LAYAGFVKLKIFDATFGLGRGNWPPLPSWLRPYL